MIRTTIAAGLAGVAIVAATWSTVDAAAADPCDTVPAAQDRLQAATAAWEGTSVAYDIATDHGLSNVDTIYANLKVERVRYAKAIAAYDAARDACAASK